MKSALRNIIAFTALLFLSSCVANMQESGKSKSPKKDYSNYATLAEALRSVGTLQVTGDAGANQVKLKLGKYENTNINYPGDNNVLFVLNGRDYGKDLGQVSSQVTPAEIESIRVLNGPEAVMRWGERGTGGVVVIKTKPKEAATSK